MHFMVSCGWRMVLEPSHSFQADENIKLQSLAQGLVFFLHLEHNRRNVLQPHRQIWEVTLLQ